MPRRKTRLFSILQQAIPVKPALAFSLMGEVFSSVAANHSTSCRLLFPRGADTLQAYAGQRLVPMALFYLQPL